MVKDFNEVEKEVDEEFSRIPMPHKIKDFAVWYVLTAIEDFLRMLYTRWVEKDPEEIAVVIDESKYALRHCLDQVAGANLVDEKFPLPVKIDSDAYVRAHTLYVAAVEFYRFSRLAGSIHTGRAQLFDRGIELSLEYKEPFSPGYGALELLDQGQENNFDISTLLYEALNGSRNQTDIELAICNTARLKGRRVSYIYNPILAFALAQEIPQRPILFPREFVFPWGTAHETLALINALHVRCLYHLLAVQLTAKRHGLRGGAEDSLVLALGEIDLVKELSYLADIGDEKISTFVRYLTYGYKSKTPDPSLQPFIRTRNDKLLLGCAHIITSDCQRNILSLVARISTKDFDRQSKHFESEMMNELISQMGTWPLKAANKVLSINGQKEEIDLVVIDPNSNTLLLLELRWMLQPGDPREVSNRYDVCEAKVIQLSRKISFVKNNLKEVVDRTFASKDLEVNFASWEVHGIVVIKGFGGHVSSIPTIPVITSDILKIALSELHDGATLYKWVASLRWLPQEDVHFCVTSEVAETKSYTIRRPAMFLKANNDQYINYVKSTLADETL